MVRITSAFRKTMIETFHEQGADWLARLPDQIRQYEERWSLQVLDPFGLSYSYCAPAVRAGGEAVVLKLSVPTADFTHQVRALRYYNGQGMVRMLEEDAEHGALLMERLLPGKMLSETVMDDDEATRIAAQVMRDAWVPAPDDPTFQSVEGWMVNFPKDLAHFADGTCPLPARTIERTQALFADLTASTGPRFLLHGDLHHDNILSVGEGEGQRWRAIDPFGVVGERELEIGGFIRNPQFQLPVDADRQRMLKRRLAIFHEDLGLDIQRMSAWSAVYAAISAAWILSGDGEGWEFDAALAEFFGDLVG